MRIKGKTPCLNHQKKTIEEAEKIICMVEDLNKNLPMFMEFTATCYKERYSDRVKVTVKGVFEFIRFNKTSISFRVIALDYTIPEYDGNLHHMDSIIRGGYTGKRVFTMNMRLMKNFHQRELTLEEIPLMLGWKVTTELLTQRLK